ncbi:MAG: Rieske 2Fe-2S domain-containing protein [Myxococcaceae bacterium]
MPPAAHLAPPPTKGHVSVVSLPNHWFIACRSEELKAKPLGRTLQGTPLVLFRDEAGAAACFLDRCPHRNVPLSAGRVVQGHLQCGYHGWRFDRTGQCRAIPGLEGEPDAKSRRASSYAVRELDGFVWVYSTPDVAPSDAPFRFPALEDARYHHVRRGFTVKGTLLAALENTLDVPHTAYLHAGLFRGGEAKNTLDVTVRRLAQGVEAEYRGEPRPVGVVGKLLAPGGGVVEHFDRFLLPSIAQVEYRLGDRSHLLVTSAMTPVSDFETTIYAVVTFRLPIPAWVVKSALTPVATRIFAQDARILALQTNVVERFGGEQFASSEVDVLGQQIWRLLREAERGAIPPPSPEDERTFKMRV